MAVVLKTTVPGRVPGVRIPPSPPDVARALRELDPGQRSALPTQPTHIERSCLAVDCLARSLERVDRLGHQRIVDTNLATSHADEFPSLLTQAV
jgi:hypothetical protein